MAGEPDTASAQLGLEAAKHGSRQLPTAAPNRRRADPARYPPARRKRHLPRSVPRNGGAAGHGTGRQTTKLAGTHRDRSLPPLPASARGCADGWMDGRTAFQCPGRGGFTLPVRVLAFTGRKIPPHRSLLVALLERPESFDTRPGHLGSISGSAAGNSPHFSISPSAIWE